MFFCGDYTPNDKLLQNVLHDGRKTFVNVNNDEERYQTHAEHPLYNTFLLGTSMWNAIRSILFCI